GGLRFVVALARVRHAARVCAAGGLRGRLAGGRGGRGRDDPKPCGAKRKGWAFALLSPLSRAALCRPAPAPVPPCRRPDAVSAPRKGTCDTVSHVPVSSSQRPARVR